MLFLFFSSHITFLISDFLRQAAKILFCSSILFSLFEVLSILLVLPFVISWCAILFADTSVCTSWCLFSPFSFFSSLHAILFWVRFRFSPFIFSVSHQSFFLCSAILAIRHSFMSIVSLSNRFSTNFFS